MSWPIGLCPGRWGWRRLAGSGFFPTPHLWRYLAQSGWRYSILVHAKRPVVLWAPGDMLLAGHLGHELEKQTRPMNRPRWGGTDGTSQMQCNLMILPCLQSQLFVVNTAMSWYPQQMLSPERFGTTWCTSSLETRFHCLYPEWGVGMCQTERWSAVVRPPVLSTTVQALPRNYLTMQPWSGDSA